MRLCAAVTSRRIRSAWSSSDLPSWRSPPDSARASSSTSAAAFSAAATRPSTARAKEASSSRVYGGIHWPIDGVEGLKMGRKIGQLVVQRAERDGVDR